MEEEKMTYEEFCNPEYRRSRQMKIKSEALWLAIEELKGILNLEKFVSSLGPGRNLQWLESGLSGQKSEEFTTEECNEIGVALMELGIKITEMGSAVIIAESGSVELKDSEIMRGIKLAYVAERFFSRSGSWICHKVNHDVRNGKRDYFTDAEQEKLKQALSQMGRELIELSGRI